MQALLPNPAPDPRHRSRALSWLLLGLLLALIAWLGTLQWTTPPVADVYQADPNLLGELDAVPLPVTQAPSTTPDDWPQWRGAARDGVTGARLLTQWPPEGPKVVWKVPIGVGYSCMAVVGERLLTMERQGDAEVVVCLGTRDGKELWRFPYACPYSNLQGNGPRATPTVHDDLVYTVGATGQFYCLRLETGAQVWHHDLLAEFNAPAMEYGVACSPLIEGDLVYASPGGPSGHSVAAFDRRDGKLVWKALDDPGGYSSPIAVTAAGVRQVIFFTGTRLVSVAPATGKEYWAFPWPTHAQSNIATPIAVGDYTFISTSYGRGCALLKTTAAPPDRLRVEQVYAHTRMRNHFSTGVYHREHVYGFHENFLACMAFRTGALRWTQRGFDKGSLLLADDQLIVLGEFGTLAVGPASPAEFQPSASCQLTDEKCWTMPVLARGRLYVRTATQLICLDVSVDRIDAR